MAYFQNALTWCERSGSSIDTADVHIAWADAYCYWAEQSYSVHSSSYHEKALGHYKQATGRRESAKAYMGMGKAYAALHYNEEAIYALEQALKLNSSYADCYFIQGNCYYEMEKFAQAHERYKAALDCGLNTAVVHNASGDALVELKRYHQAIKVFEYVTGSLDDKNAHAYCSKAKALVYCHRYEEAIKCFELATSIEPLRCSLPHVRRVLEDMSHFLDISLYRHPSNASHYKQKGDGLMLLEPHKGALEAIEFYGKAIMYGDESADVYYSRGEAYFVLQDYQNALADFRKTLLINPTHQHAQRRKKEIEMQMVPQHGLLEKLTLWIKSFVLE